VKEVEEEDNGLYTVKRCPRRERKKTRPEGDEGGRKRQSLALYMRKTTLRHSMR